MKHNQRYISKELTHFAGRPKPGEQPDREKQYQVLLTILREGCLRHRFGTDLDLGSPARVTFNASESFSDRKMITFDGVCFCDIPVADFPIHIGKYSSFGIGFLKPFLIKQGATPVFYIAKDSLLSCDDVASAMWFPEALGERHSRGDVFDRLIRDHVSSHFELQFRNALDAYNARTIDEYHGPYKMKHFLVLEWLIRTQLISFCVPFDSSKDDDDKENFYMEREWRVIGPVKFTLDDVYRVIIPESYAKRFREEFPGYTRQVTFAEELVTGDSY